MCLFGKPKLLSTINVSTSGFPVYRLRDLSARMSLVPSLLDSTSLPTCTLFAMLQSSAVLSLTAFILFENCKRRTQAGAPEHFQSGAPGAPLARIDFGCNMQQIGQCNVPSALAPFPCSSAPRGNGMRRAGQRARISLGHGVRLNA